MNRLDALEGLGEIEALGANSFYLANSHANAAAKVYGAKGYEKRRRLMDEQLRRLRESMSGKPAGDQAVAHAANTIASATAAYDQFAAVCVEALRLLAAAEKDYSAKGPPSIWLVQRDSKVPPSGIDTDSWNLSWYVNLPALSALLPRLDEQSARAENLIDVAAAAVKALEGKTWVATAPTRIDWSKSDEIVLTPQVAQTAAAVGNAAVKTAKFAVGVGLGGLALVAVIAVAGLLLWKGGSRG